MEPTDHELEAFLATATEQVRQDNEQGERIDQLMQFFERVLDDLNVPHVISRSEERSEELAQAALKMSLLYHYHAEPIDACDSAEEDEEAVANHG